MEDNTILRGIICNQCGNELPPMTIRDHIDSKFNQECPHILPYEGRVENFVKRILNKKR